MKVAGGLEFDRDWDWEFFERAGISRERVLYRLKTFEKGRKQKRGKARRRYPHVGYRCVVCGRWFLECVSPDGSAANVWPKKHKVLRKIENGKANVKVMTNDDCPGSFQLAEWVTVWEYTTVYTDGTYKIKKGYRWRHDDFKLNGE